MTVTNTTVEALVAKIEGAAKFFVGVAKAAVAWVDAKFPSAQTAMANLVSAGEAAMVALEDAATNGLGDVVTGAESAAETYVANLIQASGISVNSKTALTAAEVAVLNQVGTIATSAVTAGLAKVVAAAVATAV